MMPGERRLSEFAMPPVKHWQGQLAGHAHEGNPVHTSALGVLARANTRLATGTAWASGPLTPQEGGAIWGRFVGILSESLTSCIRSFTKSVGDWRASAGKVRVQAVWVRLGRTQLVRTLQFRARRRWS